MGPDQPGGIAQVASAFPGCPVRPGGLSCLGRTHRRVNFGRPPAATTASGRPVAGFITVSRSAAAGEDQRVVTVPTWSAVWVT